MITTVEPLDAGRAGELEAVIEIYRAAIEPSEQKPIAQLRKLAVDPQYGVVVARVAGEVAGFAMLYFPRAAADFWLLEYMAVSDRFRSRGVGSRLFAGACEAAEARASGSWCVLEVDQPGAAVSSNNEVERRLRFYARLGCKQVEGLNYILPLDVAGPPPIMMLLVHALAAGDEISAQTLRQWLLVIYSEVYDCSPDDERIDAMMLPGLERYRLCQVAVSPA